MNNRKDQAADFFPVGQLRTTYYRPDVIARVLPTRNEAMVLKLSNDEVERKEQQVALTKLLPPVVDIMSPADGSEVLRPV